MSFELAPKGVVDLWTAFTTRERFALTVGSLLCIGLTLWLARTLDVPAAPGRAGALLQQDAAVVAIGVVAVALIAGAALAASFASRVHFEGGLFCACVGLAVVSIRLGSTNFALFAASGRGVYFSFAAELLLLFAMVGIAWFILRLWMRLGWLAAEPQLAHDEPEPTTEQKLLACAAQAVLMVLLMMIFSQSDVKAQALASVGISCYLAALGACYFIPVRPSLWFLVGPLAVGLFGYVGQYFTASDWMIGDPSGFFAPLSRPMPIDYASLGCAGALMGYWTAHRWHEATIAAEAPL
jgi:hypothetical protein